MSKAPELQFSDYCVIDTPAEYRLSQFERLTLVGGRELERALEWIAKQINRFSCDGQLGQLDSAAIEEAVNLYCQASWRADPASFFVNPTGAPEVEIFPVHGLKDGEIVDINFLSAYKPSHSAFLEEFEACQENKKVYARIWRHHKPARATVVALHGWTMGDQKVNALALQPGFLYSLGLNVVLVELPYHGRRAEAKQSGSLPVFPDSNLIRTNEAMGQVISDLRELRLFLESQGSVNIGCLGMSLGGYCAALWASIDELAFCIPMVPMVDMAEVAWEILQRSKVSAKLLPTNLTLDVLKKIYRIHCPLNYKPRLPVSRRLIVAGLGDEVVSPRQPHMLWEHWERPAIQWFSGGHSAQFRNSKAFQEIGRFLQEQGFADSMNES